MDRIVKKDVRDDVVKQQEKPQRKKKAAVGWSCVALGQPPIGGAAWSERRLCSFWGEKGSVRGGTLHSADKPTPDTVHCTVLSLPSSDRAYRLMSARISAAFWCWTALDGAGRAAHSFSIEMTE